MNDEESKRIWRQQKFDPAKLSPVAQMNLMRMKLKYLDRAHLFADTVIVGLGAACVLFFAWILLKNSPSLARIGVVIMIVSLCYDVWKPIRERRASPGPLADAPVAEWLRNELEWVRAQSELKGMALWSHFLPFWMGSLLFTWGLDINLSARITFSALLTLMQLILYVGSLKLNHYTRRKALLPLKTELEALLKLDVIE